MVYPDRLASARDVVAGGFEKAKSTGSDYVRGIFRLIKADSHVRLGGEIVDFARPNLLDCASQASSIGHIAVVEVEGDGAPVVRIGVDRVQPLGVERGSPADQAVHFVPLFEQEFR